METTEPKQQQVVYIINLENSLQKDGTKLYDEEDPDKKKPAAKNRFVEEPSLNNLNHVELYKESGSDNDHIVDSLKGEYKKNSKQEDYTNMDEKKEGKLADLLNKEKP